MQSNFAPEPPGGEHAEIPPVLLDFKDGIVADRDLDSSSRDLLGTFFEIFYQAPRQEFMMNCTIFGHVLANEQRLKTLEDTSQQLLSAVQDLTKAISGQDRITPDQEFEVRKVAKTLVMSEFRDMSELKDDIMKDLRKNKDFKVVFKTGEGERRMQRYVGEQASYVKNILRDVFLSTTIGKKKGSFKATVKELKDKLLGKKPSKKHALMILFYREYVRQNTAALSHYSAARGQEADAAGSTGGRHKPTDDNAFFDLTEAAWDKAKAEYGQDIGETAEWKELAEELKLKELSIWPKDDFDKIIPLPTLPTSSGSAPRSFASSARNALSSAAAVERPSPAVGQPTGPYAMPSPSPWDDTPPYAQFGSSPSPAPSGTRSTSCTPGPSGPLQRAPFTFENPQVDHAGNPYAAIPPPLSITGSPREERRIVPLPRRSGQQLDTRPSNNTYRDGQMPPGAQGSGPRRQTWNPMSIGAMNGASAKPARGLAPSSSPAGEGYSSSHYGQADYQASQAGGSQVGPVANGGGLHSGSGNLGNGAGYEHYMQD